MACSVNNIALQSTATQVDTFQYELANGNAVDLEASRAIDGNKHGTYEHYFIIVVDFEYSNTSFISVLAEPLLV